MQIKETYSLDSQIRTITNYKNEKNKFLEKLKENNEITFYSFI